MAYGFVLEEVRRAVRNNKSYAGVLRELGKNPYSSGSQGCLKRYIIRHEIDNSHFTGQGHGKSVSRKKWYELSPYISTHVLKLKIWRDGIFEKKCMQCGISEWQGKFAPLQLHHIDGNRMNNDISNIQILCANCHAQTDTFCKRKRHLTSRAVDGGDSAAF